MIRLGVSIIVLSAVFAICIGAEIPKGKGASDIRAVGTDLKTASSFYGPGFYVWGLGWGYPFYGGYGWGYPWYGYGGYGFYG